jgi:hypothetical protein
VKVETHVVSPGSAWTDDISISKNALRKKDRKKNMISGFGSPK